MQFTTSSSSVLSLLEKKMFWFKQKKKRLLASNQQTLPVAFDLKPAQDINDITWEMALLYG